MMTKPRSKAALIRKRQKQVDVKTAREWFYLMIQEVREEEHIYAGAALLQLETRVKDWRP
jgi:hypothetical protein